MPERRRWKEKTERQEEHFVTVARQTNQRSEHGGDLRHQQTARPRRLPRLTLPENRVTLVRGSAREFKWQLSGSDSG